MKVNSFGINLGYQPPSVKETKNDEFMQSLVETSSTKASTETADTKKAVMNSFISELEKQYNLKITVYSDEKALDDHFANVSGYDNVMISYKVLEKMQSNPEMWAELEKEIRHDLRGYNDWMSYQKEVTAEGKSVIRSGCIIDSDYPRTVGMWCEEGDTFEGAISNTMKNTINKIKSDTDEWWKDSEEKQAKFREWQQIRAKRLDAEPLNHAALKTDKNWATIPVETIGKENPASKVNIDA